MSTPIKPLGDRVVATREKAAERTASGLYIPESAQEKNGNFYRRGCWRKGERR